MTGVSTKIKQLSKLTKEEWKEYTKTVWHVANVVHPNHPAVFPPEIPRRLIKLFSFCGETILDPFAGTGTTGLVATELRRNAICIDQSRKYVKEMEEKVNQLESRNGSPLTFEIIKGDSRDMKSIGDETIDLIVTSPPYWNKADYGKGKSNLGAIKSYTAFFEKINPVLQESYRVLRPGRKICIVTANVNQFTDMGLLTFPLAADFINALRDAGFVITGEVIWSKDKTGGRWGSANGQRPIFGSYPYPPNFLFKTVHEHIIVASKPPGQKKKGAKVKPYKQLMKGFPWKRSK